MYNFRLPAATVCAHPPFKNQLGNGSEEAFLQSVYAYSDLFLNTSIYNAEWNVSVSRSSLLGQCYTLTKDKSVRALSMKDRIVFKSGVSANIYSGSFAMTFIYTRK